MSNSEDVKALFRRFGGNPSTYQEIVSHDQVGQAEQKWPMLKQINPAHHEEAPSVHRFDSSDGPRQLQAELPAPHPKAATQARLRESLPALVPAQAAEPLRRGLLGRPAVSSGAGVAGLPAVKTAAEPPRVGGGMFAGRGAGLNQAPTSSPKPSTGPQPKAPSGLPGSKRGPLAQPARGEVAVERVAMSPPSPPLSAAQAVPRPAAKSGVERMLGGALEAFGVRKPAETEATIERPRTPERAAPAGLGHVFISKLATPANSPIPVRTNGLGAPNGAAEAGGLSRLFESLRAPAPPAAEPKGAGPGRGKRAVKW